MILVDDIDAEQRKFKWCVSRHKKGYHIRRKSGKIVYLHREILGRPGYVVDHINGDTLDNRRANLRACSQAENVANSAKRRGSSSHFKGVRLHSKGSHWMACITKNGRATYLGIFKDESDAARAYDRAALQYFGDFARLNFGAP